MSKRSKESKGKEKKNQCPTDYEDDEGYASSPGSAVEEVANSEVSNGTRDVVDNEQPCSSNTAKKRWEAEDNRRKGKLVRRNDKGQLGSVIRKLGPQSVILNRLQY